MEITVLARNAYESFINKYGVEPGGLLMSELTYELLKEQNRKIYIPVPDSEYTTFFGIPIFRSNQMEDNRIRFVI